MNTIHRRYAVPDIHNLAIKGIVLSAYIYLKVIFLCLTCHIFPEHAGSYKLFLKFTTGQHCDFLGWLLEFNLKTVIFNSSDKKNRRQKIEKFSCASGEKFKLFVMHICKVMFDPDVEL